MLFMLLNIFGYIYGSCFPFFFRSYWLISKSDSHLKLMSNLHCPFIQFLLLNKKKIVLSLFLLKLCTTWSIFSSWCRKCRWSYSWIVNLNKTTFLLTNLGFFLFMYSDSDWQSGYLSSFDILMNPKRKITFFFLFVLSVCSVFWLC